MLDKEQASQAPLCSVISARSAGNYGSFCGFKNGVNIRAVISSLRSLSPNAYSHKKKTGVTPGKEIMMSKKEKFPLYLSPEKKATLERRYTEDGSRSLTAFIENAIDFYLD